VVFYHRIRNMLQERGLPRARRSDDESSLTFPDGRHEIHDPRRVTLRYGLKPDSFQRAENGEFIEGWKSAGLFWILPVDLGQTVKLRAACAAPGFALKPLAVSKVEFPNHFGGDEDVAGVLNKPSLGVPDESKTFS
jgi:hypothetical protein